jgi:hypothetical protein
VVGRDHKDSTPLVELLEKLAALVPLPRVHLARYDGYLASHSHRCGALIPTPRQQGIDEEATDTRSPSLDLGATAQARVCARYGVLPLVSAGALRIIAAMTHGEVIRKLLQHLQLSADPPPIAPSQVRQEAFAWSSV